MSLLEMNIKKIKWPQIDDILFDPSNNDPWMNACLDYVGQKEKFYVYAIGYQKAAKLIYKNIDKKSSYQDILVYPIVFLYRQCFELFMKDIIITGYHLLNISQEYPKHHSLKKLWKETKTIIIKLIEEHDKDELIIVENLINEFDSIDPISFVFRYPENKKGEKSLKSLERIDLRNFYEVSTGICNYFIGTTSMLADYLENLSGE